MLAVVDAAYALEERLVEGYLIRQLGQHGHHLLFYLTQLVGLVGLGQGEEHAADAVQLLAALLQGDDGVLEGGRVGALHYLLDFLAVLLDSLLEGRQVVGRLDLAEVGGAEG